MRRLLKLLLAVVVLAALSQVPFAYRRYQLGRLDATIRELNAARAEVADAGFADFRGVLHVHSFLGGDSTGSLEEIVAGARANSLHFVVMSEHPSRHFDTRAATLGGTHEGVLFLRGSETSEVEQDRLLTFGAGLSTETRGDNASGDAARGDTTGDDTTREPADEGAADLNGRGGAAGGGGVAAGAGGGASTQSPVAPTQSPVASTQSLVGRAKAAGDLVFVAHPETFTGWQTVAGFDGMEVYNLHADALHARRLSLLFDGLWSYRAYPHLLWVRFSQTPTENLRRWDELTAAGRRVVAVAGNDAHANVGLRVESLAGETLFGLTLDPYERSFRVVRTHVLVPRGEPFGEASLLGALARGHAYVAFDLLCDATGFRLTASNGAEQKTMGDEIALASGVRLEAATPVASRFALFKDGRKVDEREGLSQSWEIKERGVYRVECYLPRLPDPLSRKPWIISNPVYVR